jgi:hypothetical protein
VTRAGAILAGAALVGAWPAGIAAAAPAAAEDGVGWHAVKEGWAPVPEGPLTLPAARYCGNFDLTLTPTRQDVQAKVLTRWDGGAVRTVTYVGPLLSTATNEATGASADLNLSGHATATYDAAGALDLYETEGPVAIGFPTGASDQLEQGMYLLTGHHVVDFGSDGTRTLVVDDGTETNICGLVG